MIIDHGKNYQFLRVHYILQGEIMNIFLIQFALDRIYYEHNLVFCLSYPCPLITQEV